MLKLPILLALALLVGQVNAEIVYHISLSSNRRWEPPLWNHRHLTALT